MTEVELEWRLIYAIVVAGKSARFANEAVGRLRRAVPENTWPITWLAANPVELEFARTGRYRLIVAALRDLVATGFDLRTVGPEKLETVHGIGPKTARFFVVWTRPEARFAVLDRHVLGWLRDEGYVNVPTGAPTGRLYDHWEGVFLIEADNRGKTPRELDLEIWGPAATAPNATGGEARRYRRKNL